jgi:hypothetical protein
VGRVAFVMTYPVFYPAAYPVNFLKLPFKPVKTGFLGTQSRTASLLAFSVARGARSARRGPRRASGIKVHVSYKQHSGETISMFHVEQKGC